ncbi:FAD-binding oxidoreductase [Aspergillus glaucus CBS 516.65]|uniref:FAD-binding PCMH-type domain-containing protein n=1 Tax=Aspergillus glaucus CBS 516.65 TaxID=1160497 RepID=A0A1L9VKS6_ASPGL|nr:hypothetical protein ASPGLDRAFT_25197 [Aspergillus glaucus CBS 516.65]OJJ84495.1 hypothetical protein ASPGLDRAFT_25197 [Aspergillus glaucus CBS 516.65]
MASILSPVVAQSLNKPVDQPPFDPTVDCAAGSEIVQHLRHLDQALKVYTPSSPNYETLRSVYNKQITARPQAICRPTTVAQVQAIVRASTQLGVPLARHAGHAGDGLVDSLSHDLKTINVGGGTFTRNLVGFLDTHDLVTASSTAGCIGWTGWALSGGYGPLNSYAGFGADNIVSAKVVTADGNVVDAGANDDLLWGIRGAGGSLGIVVESTVQTYAVPTMLGGQVQYKQGESAKALLGLQRLLEAGVPEELGLQLELSQQVVNVIVGWVGDVEEGQEWLNMVRGLAEVQLDTVEQTTLNALQGLTTKDIPLSAHTATRGVSITRMTPEVIDILQQSLSEAGASYTVTGLLNYGRSAQTNSSASFGLREPHAQLFVNAYDELARMADASGWVNGLANRIQNTGQAMEASYASFAAPGDKVNESFGDGLDKLRELKAEIDPSNVFRGLWKAE